MPDYPELKRMLTGLPSRGSPALVFVPVIQYLVAEWVEAYSGARKSAEIVEVGTGGSSYLFDLGTERLVAAWRVSEGRASHTRDKSRMAGHPLSAGALYHRGHAIPHTLGGGTDINLVAQLGSINIGAFRVLEKQAVATPGSLYFTYWSYRDAKSQTPKSVQQGFLRVGHPPDIRTHTN